MKKIERKILAEQDRPYNFYLEDAEGMVVSVNDIMRIFAEEKHKPSVAIEEMVEKKWVEYDQLKEWNKANPNTEKDWLSSSLQEAYKKGQQDLVERICQDMFNDGALVLGLEYIANLKKEVLGGKLEPIKTYKKGIEDCVEQLDLEIEQYDNIGMGAMLVKDSKRIKQVLVEKETLKLFKQQLLKLGE